VQQSILGNFVNVSTCPQCNGSGEHVATPCVQCNGRKFVQKTRSINVKIPAGVDSETQIRLTNEGAPGEDGGPPGNLYVLLTVRDHEFFRRRGNDILLDLQVNVAQAALGDEVEVPTVDGPMQMAIPAGSQSGTVFRLRNRGVPYLRRDGRGDQLVVVQVVVPRSLTEEQRELFEQLAGTLGKEVVPQKERGILNQLKDALGDMFGF
jgi:molecular chaperone DnaJ